MPSRVIDNKSPYEILYNKPPSLDHLRVIGCKANAYNLTTDKFAPKSTPTVLIGYPQNQKGYLLYDTTTHKVITTRNVTFDEHVFPFHTINTPSPSQSQTDPYSSHLIHQSHHHQQSPHNLLLLPLKHKLHLLQHH